MPQTADDPQLAACSTRPSDQTVKFHLSLNVTDLARSIAFYRVLFDCEPAKQFADYAKFEINEPPVVLSLEPQPHARGGALNHLGFRVPSPEALVQMQRRLESAGMTTTREDGVECCHATQTKFWIADPDGNNWEIYVLEDDAGHCHDGEIQPSHVPAPAQKNPISWEHAIGTPIPQAIPLSDASADQILLRGTFNEPLDKQQTQRILRESWRALRNGGKLIVHGLVSNVALHDPPQLPGPASAVRFVPLETAILESLRAAGFSGVQITRFSESPVFRHEDAALREMMIEASKLVRSSFAIRQTVIYLGPASRIVDDHGNVFERGKRTIITSDLADCLRGSPLAASFAFIPPGEDAA